MAYNNWGAELSEQAQTLSGEQQQQRFAEACEKYSKATCKQSGYADAYSNWATAYLGLSRHLTGQERENKIQQAEGLLLKAKEAGSKSYYYNVACLRAVQLRLADAHESLQEARDKNDLPNYAHLSTDHDLDNLRELDWFQQLLEEIRQQEVAQTVQPA